MSGPPPVQTDLAPPAGSAVCLLHNGFNTLTVEAFLKTTKMAATALEHCVESAIVSGPNELNGSSRYIQLLDLAT